MIDLHVAGVLFDMDGTLVDSTEIVVGAWTRFGERHGIDPAEILAWSHGRQTIDTVTRFLPDVPHDDRVALSEQLVADEVENTHGIVEVPGAAAFVGRLRAAGVPFALVTSAPHDLAVNRMRAAGVPLPDALVTSESVERGKPDPSCFVRGAEMLGLDPRDCAAFEDAPAGLQAAIAAGAVTVVVGPLEHEVTTGLGRLSGYDGIEVTTAGAGFRIRG